MLINGRTFYEHANEPRSPRKSWALDSSRTTRTLSTRGDSTDDTRAADVAALLGYQHRALNGGRFYLKRILPDFYPIPVTAPTGLDGLLFPQYAVSIPISEPLSGKTSGIWDEGSPVYEGWKYTVEYRSLPYFIRADDDVLATDGPLAEDGELAALPDEGDALRLGWATNSRYVAKTVDPAPRSITLPNGFAKFVKDAGEVNAPPVPSGLPISQFRSSVTYTWMSVPVNCIPYDAITRCTNAVNNSTFDNFATETLFFSSYRLIPVEGALGEKTVHLEYRFIYQPVVDFDGADYATYGWNHFYGVIGDKLRARELTIRKDGAAPSDNSERIFKQQDFTTLFRPTT